MPSDTGSLLLMAFLRLGSQWTGSRTDFLFAAIRIASCTSTLASQESSVRAIGRRPPMDELPVAAFITDSIYVMHAGASGGQ